MPRDWTGSKTHARSFVLHSGSFVSPTVPLITGSFTCQMAYSLYIWSPKLYLINAYPFTSGETGKRDLMGNKSLGILKTFGVMCSLTVYRWENYCLYSASPVKLYVWFYSFIIYILNGVFSKFGLQFVNLSPYFCLKNKATKKLHILLACSTIPTENYSVPLISMELYSNF